MEVIQDGFTKGTSQLSEDDVKFTLVAMQMKMEAGNIASGKYKAKKFDEAADYFYKVAYLNMAMTRKKDTSNFYNACVSAGRAKNPTKISLKIDGVDGLYFFVFFCFFFLWLMVLPYCSKSVS